MRRFASVDFLRGFAIWLMLLLHELMRVLDYSWADDLQSDLFRQLPIIYVVLMLLVLFLAGWCGFFLLISSIGNTISMYKALKRGDSVGKVVAKQLLLGFLLLLFAFFIEAIGGYGGMLGDVVLGKTITLDYLWGFFIAETIHAIAYANIVTGILGGLLSINDGIKKVRRNILINIALAIVVIAITAIVYNVPMTYGGITTVQEYGTIQSITSNPDGRTVSEFFIKIFLLPFIGRPEPLLPFLATALIGNAIGILLVQEKPFWKELKIGMAAATALTFGGLGWALIMVANGKQDLFELFLNGWSIASLAAWLPMYLFTLGTQLIAVFLVIRLVEFRGKGKEFANRTKYFRRHGFVALSVYAFQFLDVIPRWILAGFPCVPTPTGCTTMIGSNGVLVDKNLWGPWVFLIIVVNFVIWHVVLVLWEKINYIGGYEWLINVIAGFFIKSRRVQVTKDGVEKFSWWKPKRLDVQTNFYDPEWVNIVEKNEIDHENKMESKAALKVTAINLILNALVFFLPVTIIGMFVAFSSRKTEGKNKYNTAAIICGIIGCVIFVASIIIMSNIPNSVLGL
ncbi:MAG: hypothetical protein ACTSQF_14270 [Candidatus Heimdallarchaeaceae archaeon]